MAKGPSPLLGFNNNVRHRGKIFHIQTEDSGVRHPHVITHLFSDGGRIIKTTKTSYAEYVGGENMAGMVRQLMKEQHKAMFLALRGGLFDETIDSGESGTPPARPQTSVPPDEAPSTPRPPDTPTSGERPLASAPRPHVTPFEPPPTADLFEPFSLPAAPFQQAPAATPSQTPRPASPLRPAPSAAPGRAPALSGPSQPPRPSPGASARPAGEAHHGASSPASARGEPKPAPPASTSRARQEPAPLSEGPPPGSGRVASRSSFPRSTRPSGGRSIFGDDLISEKSLDEVILSYLADDLDGTSNLP